MSAVSSLEELYAAQLRELFSAETQSVPALIALLDAADDAELANCFRSHCVQTLDHAEQLERLLTDLGQPARGADCEAIEAWLQEAQKAAEDQLPSAARDLTLIKAAQRIEQFEMACYGSVHTYATVLNHDEVAGVLQKILDQETEADRGLAEISNRLNADLPDRVPVSAAFQERNP
jgi:ferritin-like metal-binding protein YciE